jgi:hypothetical protein
MAVVCQARLVGLSVSPVGHAPAMTDATPSAEKPVDEWVTGEEPMTGPQRSYLETLARDAGVEVPDGLTKAAASTLIEELQQQTGRKTTERSGGQEQAGPADVDDLIEEGIVDQQAAADVPADDTDR